MTVEERIDVARQYRALANRLSLEGESVAAGEMLWGAVHNVLQGIGTQHNLLDPGRHEIRRATVIAHLVEHHDQDISLFNGLSSAGVLHGHFYNHHLLVGAHQELMRATVGYVDTLLAIASPSQS